MSWQAILDKAYYMLQREGIGPYGENENYEWRLSYDLASALGKQHIMNRETEFDLYALYGIPVNIIYEKTNTIELWKKVG